MAVVRLRPLSEILDRYLGSFPVAHALFRAAELRNLAGQELLRPVLDLGCGTGQFADMVAEGPMDAGLDLCPRRLQIAQSQEGYLDLRQGDARDLPFPDGSFATVVSLSALEHMIEPEKVVREVHRVLKPGGTFTATLVLSDLHRNLLMPGILRTLGLDHLAGIYERTQDRVFNHRTLLSRESWESMLRDQGFTVQRSERVVRPRVTRLWDALLWTAWPFHLLGGLGQGLPRKPTWLRNCLARVIEAVDTGKDCEGSVLFFTASKSMARKRCGNGKAPSPVSRWGGRNELRTPSPVRGLEMAGAPV